MLTVLSAFVARFIAAPGIVLAAAVDLPQRTVVLNTGIRISLTQAFSNFYGFLAITAVSICTLIFLLGAASLVISAGDQTKVDNGKKMMIGALVGLAIALGSYAILRTVLYFLYVGAP